MYSPRTNRHLPAQSHHPSWQSWKKDSYKSLKTLEDKNAVSNFIWQRDMNVTCFARHTSLSPGTARHNFQSKDSKKLFETTVRGVLNWFRWTDKEIANKDCMYQVLLQNNNHTRNLLHPPSKHVLENKMHFRFIPHLTYESSFGSNFLFCALTIVKITPT